MGIPTGNSSVTDLQSVGITGLRTALAVNLLWIGGLKFKQYEVTNIHPLVSSSPLFARFARKLGEPKLAKLIGLTEIALGSLIAARPIAPRASAIGSLGAVGMFATTLSFLATTPGVWEEDEGPPKLSLVGQFLAKDSVYLAASLLLAAESFQVTQRREVVSG